MNQDNNNLNQNNYNINNNQPNVDLHFQNGIQSSNSYNNLNEQENSLNPKNKKMIGIIFKVILLNQFKMRHKT